MLKRFIASALAVLMVMGPAYALSDGQIPTKIPTPWASSAANPTFVRTIPIPSQVGITNCAASFTDGFPILTFTPASAGGCPPFGADMNGILQIITQWERWNQAGGQTNYDAGFSSNIGGYPKGAILGNANTVGCFWISTIENNLSNPDASGAGWTPACPGPGGAVGGNSTGSANAQVVAATPFILQKGVIISFVAGFTNTGATTFNINSTGAISVVKQVPGSGTQPLVGNEIQVNTIVVAAYDGTKWELIGGGGGGGGGSSFIGVSSSAATGTANALTFTTTPFTLQTGSLVVFFPGATNTGPTTLAINGAAPVAIKRKTPTGLVPFVGGELLAFLAAIASFDGTQYQLEDPGAVAYTNLADQNITGGANVTSLANGAGTVNVDCGLRPLQYVPNVGAFTINAPANDGSCILNIENGVGASATVSFGGGFTVGANTGDPIDNVNGHKFTVSIWKIHGVASYSIRALQ
jgi:hypothetical protein